MNEAELRKRIAILKSEKRTEGRRTKLRGEEQEAIMEAREAKRQRRIAGLRLRFEKAKVYKALPLPRVHRGEEELPGRAEKSQEAEEKRLEKTLARKRALHAAQEAKRTRIMTEKELRAERLKPYSEAAERAVRGAGRAGAEVGKGLVSAGTLVWKGLEKLGKEGQKPPPTRRREQPLDIEDIDLGLGKPGRGGPKREESVRHDFEVFP